MPHFVRPRAHFKKGQLKPDAPNHVLKTPDIDNLAKFVLDALQKKVLSDDKLVTTLVVHKRWCSTENEQRTVIELRRVLN
jgi:Holliday junction resolvase RusA-like endonuclease